MYLATHSLLKFICTYLVIPILLTLITPAIPLSAQQIFAQQEPLKTGLALHIDNDLFVGDDLDKNYTGGVALMFSGRQAISNPLSVNRVRSNLDHLTRFSRLYDSNETFKLHAFEVGFALFTPSDLSIKAPQRDEHPYASLFFLVNSQQVVAPIQNLAFSSIFTLGALGLDLAKDVHTQTHHATGSSPPMGWANQISSGGELTARYSLGVQKLVAQRRLPFNLRSEFKLSAEGDIGFTTGAGLGFNARIGLIRTPWWGFNPHQTKYTSRGTPIASNSGNQNSREFFLYFGANISHQFYNALLQGQFRKSAVTYKASEIKSENIELWAGVSHQVNRDWNIGAFVRSRTAELKNEEDDTVWGGFTIARSL